MTFLSPQYLRHVQKYNIKPLSFSRNQKENAKNPIGDELKSIKKCDLKKGNRKSVKREFSASRTSCFIVSKVQ